MVSPHAYHYIVCLFDCNFRNSSFCLDLSAISYKIVESSVRQRIEYEMSNRNAGSDNWGQLLSDFGIEDERRENVAPPEETAAVRPAETTEFCTEHPKELAEPTDLDSFGAGLVDAESETSAESKPKEKKSIFSRFPKINFFGVPPEVDLDSVVEGVKSPSLGGKAFTDNKLEKMPVSQERIERQRKHRQEEETPVAPDAWSAVASQIDVLASRDETKPKGLGTKSGERPTKRAVSSMFDDPVPESEEFRKCKDLMGEQHGRRGASPKESFPEEETDARKYDSQRRGRGRQGPQQEEKDVGGRGSRYRKPLDEDDLPGSDFVSMDDEMPITHERGRRGSRYSGDDYRKRERIQDDDLPQEEWSEVDAALQAEQGGRHQRSDGRRSEGQYTGRRRRPEQVEEPVMDRESSDGNGAGFVAVHGNIPSWDEAVSDIIVGNIARHKSHSGVGHSGRGRR